MRNNARTPDGAPGSPPAGDDAKASRDDPRRARPWHDDPRVLGWGAVVFYLLFLAVQLAFVPAPNAPSTGYPRWIRAVELSARYTLALTGMVLGTRVLARRISGDGWGAVLRVSGLGALTAALLVAFLNAVPCVIPWGDCSGRTLTWVVARAFPFTQWLAPAMALLLAWVTAFRAGTYLQDEIRGNELRRELTRAQFSMLTMQLRPHFLFNTLQSIATLMHHDVRAAERMLSGLRELFERSVALSDDPVVPVAEELALLRLYTDIESTRFGSRLQVNLHVDPAAREALVPRFLLQPLVENSIHHAVAKAGHGSVAITARLDEGDRWLVVEVTDSGPGPQGGETSNGFGLGFTNTRSRLETLYPGMHTLTLEHGPGAGVTARIRLPFQAADGGADGSAASPGSRAGARE